MLLADLIDRIEHAELVGDGETDVTRATSDSRAIEPGDLFVAVRGLRSDGHEFAAAAVEAGAAAVVLERALDGIGVPTIRVPSSAVALGEATAALMGDPASKLRLIGITGTNGKTTTTYLVEAMISASRRSPGVIGTVTYRFGGKSVEAPYTTPTAEVFHSMCRDMVESGVDDTVVEVSSIALSMERLSGTSFQVAAFTNFSQDHLDIHGSMEAYRNAKALLFSKRLDSDGVAVINVDDEEATAMLDAAKATGHRRILRVTTNTSAAEHDAEIRLLESTSTIDGISARFATPSGPIEIESRALLGHYNIANVALAIGIGEALNLGSDAIVDGIASMTVVPGRVERVPNDEGLDILVDYAHTPDALTNVLTALRPLCKRRLICVFGCGGDRDPSKRPLMGAAASRGADVTIVTSDNPRSEDPQAIIDTILPAMDPPFFVDVERELAIKAAVFEATPGDIVLIAGKGHEDYQILGSTKIKFDDREHAAWASGERTVLTLDEIAAATGGSVIGDGELEIDRAVIDGRSAAAGDLYVAIRGERFDGHNFVDQAMQSGASALLVERGVVLPATVSRVAVDDTRVALGALARYVRNQWALPVVGVTGSAGKTTTKELIAAATRTLHPLASRGSLNNETGVPLTLLGLQSYHRVAVVEMGMRGLGQIDYLCAIAEPDIGVVVNAGVAHIGVVGSEADIVRGKAEIYSRLPDNGVAVYPADDPRLARFALAAPSQISFGEAEHADVRLLEYRSLGAEGSSIRIGYAGTEYDATIQMYGRHNALNTTCALAVALSVDVPIETALAGLASARPPGMRGERIEVGGCHLLLDCYNSNPRALEAALNVVAELAEHGKTKAHAIIGDMLELGDTAEEAHREAGHIAGRLGVSVVSTGEFAEAIVEGARSEGDRDAVVTADPRSAAETIWKRARPGDWILFKASRGAKLERAVDAVREFALESERS